MNNEHGNDYEKKDVNIKMIIIIGIVSVLLVVVTIIMLNEYFLAEKEKMVYDMVLKPESITLREIRAYENEQLNSYELIDSAKGVYRIPVDRAMKLIADEAYQASKK
ncbi:MAG: hypothetical protein ACE5D6_06055 [Candidatus Zixiibacteriota bacterium]